MKKAALTFQNAYDLIKRETGIVARNLEKPETMNPDWPYYQLQSGNMQINVYQASADSLFYGSTVTALSVTHGNSSYAVTEYFYTDTLEYAAEYTEMVKREDFCDITGDKETDPAYKRLRKEASNAIWHHYRDENNEHVTDKASVSEAHDTNPSATELHSIAINEAAAFANFQGKLLQGHDLFKIRVFDLSGNYSDSQSEVYPIDETQLGWWIKEVTHGVDNNPDKAAGFTVFAWDRSNEIWMPYAPDGRSEYTYDTGRRSDGKVHEACKRSLPVISDQPEKERTPFNDLLMRMSKENEKSKKAGKSVRDNDPER